MSRIARNLNLESAMCFCSVRLTCSRLCMQVFQKQLSWLKCVPVRIAARYGLRVVVTRINHSSFYVSSCAVPCPVTIHRVRGRVSAHVLQVSMETSSGYQTQRCPSLCPCAPITICSSAGVYLPKTDDLCSEVSRSNLSLLSRV